MPHASCSIDQCSLTLSRIPYMKRYSIFNTVNVPIMHAWLAAWMNHHEPHIGA